MARRIGNFRENPSLESTADRMEPESQALEHESEFVRSFVVPERRERYLSKLASAKHRRAILDRLNHQFLGDLDSRFVVRGKQPWPTNQDKCYIFADESEYDQRLVTIAEAEEALSAASFGMVVSFVPGKLACYKDEAPSEVVWVKRD